MCGQSLRKVGQVIGWKRKGYRRTEQSTCAKQSKKGDKSQKV